MKAMIMSDLLIAKKYLLQQLGVSIAVGIFITVVRKPLRCRSHGGRDDPLLADHHHPRA